MSEFITRQFLLSLLLLCANWPTLTHAACNTCSAETNLACVSNSQFKVCDNGSPIANALDCPTGYVCSTATTSICQPSGGVGVVAGCADCNTCDATNTFACTGVGTYALCLGTTTVSNLTGSCEPDHICSIDYEYICGSATLGVVATCPSVDETVTTTTTAPSTSVTNPVAYCQSMQQSGRFPAGNGQTTSCRQYVYCFINNGVWSGVLYTCPGATYFNESSRLCTAVIPTRCVGTTRVLSLRNMDVDFD
ncbi:PREDICTED: uncharacterized protein LOC108377659 [Rhagoletis zephyria]|uniref:uncharacterized protein LOC108377659 n=1 Tax=Rhagoletis zephyria TaxID=28612 RepID=UPI00081177E7|nr:PREDICTED: uncharacterized protein LOC108377659 [Rhagoletis zephyria]